MDKNLIERIAKSKEEARERKEIEERIRNGIREGTISIDANRISEIAEYLKSQGISAGDELQRKSLDIYVDELVEKEL